MKVIDLLQKIANEEEVPLIKYRDKILHWNKEKDRFEDKNGMNTLYEMDFSELNDEVEVIEEEPRDIEVCGSLFTRSEYNRLAEIEEDKKIKKINKSYSMRTFNDKFGVIGYDVEKIIEMLQDVYKKIDEIIDYINKENI